MALVFADRVKETSTTTGTGTYTLAGATTGFRSFTAGIGDGNTCHYTATDGTDWEVGLGTYTAAGTLLARTTIYASSNAGAAVNWSAGTRTVAVVPIAQFPSDYYTHAAATTAHGSNGAILGASDIGVTVQGYDANTAFTDVANVFTVNQTVGDGTTAAERNIIIDTPAGQWRLHEVHSGGLRRWAWGANADAESTGDAGSNFTIRRYNDAGTFLDEWLNVFRASGYTTLAGDLVLDKVGGAQGDCVFVLKAQNAQEKEIRFLSGTNWRWRIYTDADEAGADSGSDLHFNNYLDSGSNQFDALVLKRSTGEGTFRHDLNIGTNLAATDRNLKITGVSGNKSSVIFQKDGLDRWKIGRTQDAESTGDAGSDFEIRRYNDAGTSIDIPFRITRSSGLTRVLHDLYVGASGEGSSQIFIEGDAGNDRAIVGRTGNSPRWALKMASAAAESTGNAGSNLIVVRYNDAGSIIDEPFRIDRNTGQATFLQQLNASAGLNATSGVSSGHTFTANDTVGNAEFNGMLIDYNVSGADALSVTRYHRGLFIDVDSSATGGTESQEHRVIGLEIDVLSSTYSDWTYGIRSSAESSSNTSLDRLIGVYGNAKSTGSGNHTAQWGGYFWSVTGGAAAPLQVIGCEGYAFINTGTTGVIPIATGVRGEVETVAGITGSVTTAYAFRAVIDDNDDSIANAYFFYGAGSAGSGNKWGVYINEAIPNYFGGEARIATTGGFTPWASGSPAQLVIGKADQYVAQSIMSYHSSTASGGGQLALGRSRGALGVLTATNSADYLGWLTFEGVDSSSTAQAGAYIVAVQEGAATATAVPANLRFHTASSGDPAEQMRLTSAGNLLIGQTSEITGTFAPYQDVLCSNVALVPDGTSTARVGFYDGTGAAALKGIIQYDSAGTLAMYQYVSSAGNAPARIWVNTSGVFAVETGESLGSSTMRRRVTVDRTGTMYFDATYGAGLQFPANLASADANTLDDYEEGSFNASVWDNSLSDAEGQQYTSRNGHYTKIGNVVYFSIYLNPSSYGTLTTSEAIRIGGLPFTSKNVSTQYGGLVWNFWASGTKNYQGPCTGLVIPNTSYAQNYEFSATGGGALNISEVSTGATHYISGHYFAA